jgi:hypothetical protein
MFALAAPPCPARDLQDVAPGQRSSTQKTTILPSRGPGGVTAARASRYVAPLPLRGGAQRPPSTQRAAYTSVKRAFDTRRSPSLA